MTVTEQPSTDTPPKQSTAPAAVPADGSPSLRTVALAFGAIAATAVGVIAFVAGGWIALAAAGGVAAVGGIATARAKNPRPRKTRPGALATLLGRPRKPGKSSGSLPWSLTGSQSRRAAKASGIRSRQTGRGKSAGTGLKLPAVTSKGRARKASTAGTGRPLATTSPARRVAKPALKPGGKPGTAAPKAAAKKTAGPGRSRAATPTKTPAKPATRPRLVTPSPKTTGGAAKKAAARPRTGATPTKRPGARPSTGRVSNGGKGATILPFKRTAKKATAARPTGRTTPKPTTGAGRRSSTPKPKAGRLLGTTGGKRLGGRATGGPATKRARRIGTTKMRRVLRGPAAKTPNRTLRRPTTGTGTPSNRRLIGTALRVPRRNARKLTWARPSKAAQRKARRTLSLRRKLAGRRMLGRLRRSPGWLYAHRPLWLWPTFVPPVNPAWRVPNAVDPASPVEVPDRERGPRRARTPHPQLVGRRAGTTPKEHVTVSNPLDQITESLDQLASFDPENALEIEQFMANLGHVFTEFSGKLAGVSDRWSGEQPLAAEVLEAIHSVASVCAGTADIADEAHSTFQTAHEAELTRLREPRANEKAWDVTQNQ